MADNKTQVMKILKFFRIILISFVFIVFQNSYSQSKNAKNEVYVDNDGVMRYENTNKEIKGFGINYTVPFAHAYRSAKRMNIDPYKAIDNDVYHFSRLGFDLYRVHVWDTEISDTLGNLIENEHLKLFDYLLKKLQEKDINYIITPIAFWGNGWPEPDEATPGFSHKYGKEDCLTDPEAIKAQQNYLYQFLNHVNSYTGIAYKDDPNVLAFEVSNEPHHKGEAKEVTAFVKGMVDAMRRTGTIKPIFYNISHAVHFAEAYFKGGIQGGTFQWYPTGLGYQRELSGNLLPNVNDYNIPFEETIKKYKGAKLVYEFDAADVGRSYIYPAMARSFREAGIQIATHFAYDPTYLSYANTEYNTHYMNLAYTPQKALSLMICAEVFREIPMYSNHGKYPQNTTFGNFKVDYKNDLAQYNTDQKFIYTNHTKALPVNEKNLHKIAGFGNSALVQYDGQGAYFLDKIDKGIWRLEVMPDAVWVDNPFGRNSPNKTVGVIRWEEHKMNIQLKDLGTNFRMEPINEGNTFITKVDQTSFSIKPGTYILSRNGIQKKWLPSDSFGKNHLKDFYAPNTSVKDNWLRHKATTETTENKPLTVTIQFISPENPKQIQLVGYAGLNRFTIEMVKANGYNYAATIPAENITKGYLHYNIVVHKKENEYLTYPSGLEGRPFDWDVYDRSTYKVHVVPGSNPIYLFHAAEDSELLIKQWNRSLKLVPTENFGEAEYQVNLEKLLMIDNENLHAKPLYDYSFKHFIIDKIKNRRDDLDSKNALIFRARALNDKPCKLQIAFVMDDGASFGTTIEIGAATQDYKISLSDLKPVRTITLPRPYPGFLPYFLEHNLQSAFDIGRVESLQFSIGPGIPEKELEEKHGLGIISVRLE